MSYKPKTNRNVRIIHSDLNTYTFTSGNDLIKRYSVTIPTLQIGEGYEIFVWGDYVNSSTTKATIITINGSTFGIASPAATNTGSGNLGWSMTSQVVKISSNQVRRIYTNTHEYSASEPEANTYTGTEVFGTVVIDVSRYIGTAVTGDISIRGFIVTLIKN